MLAYAYTCEQAAVAVGEEEFYKPATSYSMRIDLNAHNFDGQAGP